MKTTVVGRVIRKDGNVIEWRGGRWHTIKGETVFADILNDARLIDELNTAFPGSYERVLESARKLVRGQSWECFIPKSKHVPGRVY